MAEYVKYQAPMLGTGITDTKPSRKSFHKIGIKDQDNFSQENIKVHSLFGLKVVLRNSLIENRAC